MDVCKVWVQSCTKLSIWILTKFISIHPFPNKMTAPWSVISVCVAVCSSIDIRNGVEQFYKLENCTVIEGSLEILLIDYAEYTDFVNLSYPLLREITEYLLLYRVYGLRSLAHIFPNLSVIRGQKLFFNYALVAFEMQFLEDIGLPSLTHIVRGAVRLEKNSALCYVDTIDWSLIARSVPLEANFILENKVMSECANQCPQSDDNPPRHICPSVRKVYSGEERSQFLCWNNASCQIRKSLIVCRQTSSVSHTKSNKWNVCSFALQMSSSNPLSQRC